MSFKNRMENIWYHYKWVLIIGGIVLIGAVILAFDYAVKKDYDFSIGYITTTYADDTFLEPIKQDVENIVGDINDDGKVRINYNVTVHTPPNALTFDMKLAEDNVMGMQFFAGDIRIYILEEKFVNDYSIYFSELESILPKEKLLGGIIRTPENNDPEYTPKESDGKIIAVPIENFERLSELNLPNSDELYIGLRAETHIDAEKENIEKIKEKALKVFNYLTKE